MVLQDRLSERDVLDDLLEAARGGGSRVLVVRGEPGVGRSALLEYVVRARFRRLPTLAPMAHP